MVLGGFTLSGDDGTSLALPTRKDRLLLSYLAIHLDQPQMRERLYGLLWADRAEAQARGSLRQSLAAMREMFRKIKIDPLRVDRNSVTLESKGLFIDAVEFVRMAGSAAPPEKALILYRGPLLADNEAPTPEFEQWLLPARQRLEDLAAKLVEQVSTGNFSQTAVKSAADLAQQLLSRDRLREPIYRALMRMRASMHDRAGSMKAYADCRDALVTDLNLAPELETEQLYRDILTARPSPGFSNEISTGEAADVSGRPSIAVMPFSNISADPTLNPLCEGLAEDIITGLGRFRLAFVIDRNSSSVVHQTNTDTAEIGKRLGVGLVVQGSLQRLGGRIRITVRLVNAAARTQVWGDDFECDVEELPAIPEKISKSIIVTLYNRVENSLLEQSRRKPTLAAYECVLRGVKHLRGYGHDDNRCAIELLQKAIDLDPEYALARAYRAFADVVFHDYDAAPVEILAQARTMALEAVEMEPEDGRCRWLLGMICRFSGDTEGEEQQYLRALALNPNDANALATYGILLVALGRHDEGIDRTREAMRLNPYHPEWYWVGLGGALYAARRYEDALEALRRRSQPKTWVLSRIAASYAQLGRMDEAAKTVAEIFRQNPNFSISDLRGGSGWGLKDRQHLREGMRKAGLPE